MRTTADPRTLFREIDASGMREAGSYEFAIDTSQLGNPVSTGNEGEDPANSPETASKKLVKFEQFDTEEEQLDAALAAVREDSMAIVAGKQVDNEFDHDTLFIDRERNDAYLVDADRFGYYLSVSEEDPISGGYSGILSGACIRVR